MEHLPLPHPIEATYSAAAMDQFCQTRLARAEEIRQKLQDQAQAWEQAFGQMDALAQELGLAAGIANLMSVTHPEETIREAAKAWEPKFSEYITNLYLDTKVYQNLVATKQDPCPNQARQLLQDDTLREYRRNGLDLPSEKQERLKEINKELTQKGQAFESNLASAVGSIEIKAEQLEGLPQTYKDSHPPQENGRVRITTNTPDYVPFMKYAKDRDTARDLYIQNRTRAKEQNLKLLDEVLALRQEKAALLGYANWAAYILEPRMAKNPETVKAFLKDIQTSLKPVVEKDMTLLRNAGKIPASQPIPASDTLYLMDQTDRTYFSLDSQRISEYFEFSQVKQGLLQTASRVFRIEFKKNTETKTWHEDVETYDVFDQGKLLGQLFLDLHPREEKYKHAAVFGLREAHPGTTAVAALVCNFAKPGDTPALLQHDDVITFFHEFGHALHHLLSKTEFVSQAGTNVARDFVEAPSQLFEEYAWDKQTVQSFAKHYLTGETLPDELHEALAKARSFGKGIDTIQQLYYALLDQEYHTRAAGFDTTTIMENLHREILPFEPIPHTAFQATFGHLMGYDAGYYGYQWALAIAKDLLTRFQTHGLFDPETCKAYRATILAKGSSQPEAQSVEQFLERPFSGEAYKSYLGVS